MFLKAYPFHFTKERIQEVGADPSGMGLVLRTLGSEREFRRAEWIDTAEAVLCHLGAMETLLRQSEDPDGARLGGEASWLSATNGVASGGMQGREPSADLTMLRCCALLLVLYLNLTNSV